LVFAIVISNTENHQT